MAVQDVVVEARRWLDRLMAFCRSLGGKANVREDEYRYHFTCVLPSRTEVDINYWGDKMELTDHKAYVRFKAPAKITFRFNEPFTVTYGQVSLHPEKLPIVILHGKTKEFSALINKKIGDMHLELK